VIGVITGKHTAWLLGPVLLAAAVLRLLYLGDKSLWLDEAYSVLLARMGWAEALRTEPHAVLYHRLLSLWLSLGDGEAVLRAFSVIWAVATIAVVYLLGAELYGHREGIIGALLMSVNAFHVAYAQEARSYSLATLLVSLASLFFVIGIQRRSWWPWVLYVATGALAVYAHVFVLLVFPAHLASLVFLRPDQVPWKRLGASVAAIGLLLVPQGLWLRQVTAHLHWVPKPTPSSFYELLRWFVGGGGPVLLIAYLVPVALALVLAARVWESSERSTVSWKQGFLPVWLLVPVLLAYGVSFYESVFLYRNFIVCLPPLVLLGAAGLSRIRPVWFLALAVVLVAGLTLERTVFYYRHVVKEDWRGAVRYVFSEARQGDVLLFHAAYARPAFEYYRHRLVASAGGPKMTVVEDPQRISASDSRIWVVLSHEQFEDQALDQAVRTALARRHVPRSERQFFGVRVVLFTTDN
jgi:mannosyltransferase